MNKRINENITARNVQVIDENGTNLGVVPRAQALALAENASLDLVEVSFRDGVSTAKIMDYGKAQYLAKKSKVKAPKVETKEIQVSVRIEEHDLAFKVKRAQEFISNGDRVNVVMRFKGRENSHTELGFQIFERFKSLGKVTHGPKLEGNRLLMTVSPVASLGTKQVTNNETAT